MRYGLVESASVSCLKWSTARSGDPVVFVAVFVAMVIAVRATVGGLGGGAIGARKVRTVDCVVIEEESSDTVEAGRDIGSIGTAETGLLLLPRETVSRTSFA